MSFACSIFFTHIYKTKIYNIISLSSPDVTNSPIFSTPCGCSLWSCFNGQDSPGPWCTDRLYGLTETHTTIQGLWDGSYRCSPNINWLWCSGRCPGPWWEVLIALVSVIHLLWCPFCIDEVTSSALLSHPFFYHYFLFYLPPFV